MNICKSIIYSANSMDEVASTLFLQYPDIIKWAFYAPMGAGKTTLIKALIKKLGSIDEGSSPTFAIANQYKTTQHGDLFHMDLFRLHSLDEAFQAGLYEMISSPEYCFVEWPELIEPWMDETWGKITIHRLDDYTRQLDLNVLAQ